MKVIIAGGRSTRLSQSDINRLDQLSVSEVVSGGASGIDRDGEAYAMERGIPVRRFRADWNSYGRSAGPIRNRQMAVYVDCAVLFPGGRGTASMYRGARRAGIGVFDYR